MFRSLKDISATSSRPVVQRSCNAGASVGAAQAPAPENASFISGRTVARVEETVQGLGLADGTAPGVLKPGHAIAKRRVQVVVQQEQAGGPARDSSWGGFDSPDRLLGDGSCRMPSAAPSECLSDDPWTKEAQAAAESISQSPPRPQEPVTSSLSWLLDESSALESTWTSEYQLFEDEYLQSVPASLEDMPLFSEMSECTQEDQLTGLQPRPLLESGRAIASLVSRIQARDRPLNDWMSQDTEPMPPPPKIARRTTKGIDERPTASSERSALRKLAASLMDPDLSVEQWVRGTVTASRDLSSCAEDGPSNACAQARSGGESFSDCERQLPVPANPIGPLIESDVSERPIEGLPVELDEPSLVGEALKTSGSLDEPVVEQGCTLHHDRPMSEDQKWMWVAKQLAVQPDLELSHCLKQAGIILSANTRRGIANGTLVLRTIENNLQINKSLRAADNDDLLRLKAELRRRSDLYFRMWALGEGLNHASFRSMCSNGVLTSWGKVLADGGPLGPVTSDTLMAIAGAELAQPLLRIDIWAIAHGVNPDSIIKKFTTGKGDLNEGAIERELKSRMALGEPTSNDLGALQRYLSEISAPTTNRRIKLWALSRGLLPKPLIEAFNKGELNGAPDLDGEAMLPAEEERMPMASEEASGSNFAVLADEAQAAEQACISSASLSSVELPDASTLEEVGEGSEAKQSRKLKALAAAVAIHIYPDVDRCAEKLCIVKGSPGFHVRNGVLTLKTLEKHLREFKALRPVRTDDLTQLQEVLLTTPDLNFPMWVLGMGIDPKTLPPLLENGELTPLGNFLANGKSLRRIVTPDELSAIAGVAFMQPDLRVDVWAIAHGIDPRWMNGLFAVKNKLDLKKVKQVLDIRYGSFREMKDELRKVLDKLQTSGVWSARQVWCWILWRGFRLS